MVRYKKWVFLLLTLLVIGSIIGVRTFPVFAIGASDQPVEWGDNSSPTLKFSLQYLGWIKGCKKEAPNNWDHAFRLTGNFSADPERMRMGSNNWLIRWKWNGHTFMGYNLTDPNNKRVCIGNSDFFEATGATLIQNSAFVYIQ